jgi:hypothetical protein
LGIFKIDENLPIGRAEHGIHRDQLPALIANIIVGVKMGESTAEQIYNF